MMKEFWQENLTRQNFQEQKLIMKTKKLIQEGRCLPPGEI